jgi:predicted PurR-regulated permease PerM
MTRVPGPKGVGLSVAALGLVAVIGLIGFLLAWPLQRPISNAMDNWPQTQRQVDEVLRKFSVKIGLQEAPTPSNPVPADALSVSKLLEGVKAFLTGEGGQALVSKGADVLMGVLLSFAFMLIGSLFLLSEPGDSIIGPGLRLASPRYRAPLAAALAALAPRFRAWVVGTISGMGIVFVASLVGYSIINLKMALVLALLAGFAEIVPTVGPLISGVIATLFAAATQTPAHAFGVVIVWSVIQGVEAYVILPMIMRGAVNIHPAVTLFSVVLWGKIFGVAGIIMAIPINLTIWTLLEHLYIRPMEGAKGHVT